MRVRSLFHRIIMIVRVKIELLLGKINEILFLGGGFFFYFLNVENRRGRILIKVNE